ncbi:hypothetical protein MRB53_016598 [Persea americana]|uniref:Uncharacterized protein n=1 Tax=Persea americana TaxID=3435 RepID=A0ACC2M2S7_PERAE|nr:hypothetical protein MRB53_016598 [Persea americana]
MKEAYKGHPYIQNGEEASAGRSTYLLQSLTFLSFPQSLIFYGGSGCRKEEAIFSRRSGCRTHYIKNVKFFNTAKHCYSLSGTEFN